MKAFVSESLGFSVKSLADLSRDKDGIIDIRDLCHDCEDAFANPTMTDEVIHISVENLSQSGIIELPVRRIEESGGKMTISGVRHSVRSLNEAILSGDYTKKEWREWRWLVQSGELIYLPNIYGK